MKRTLAVALPTMALSGVGGSLLVLGHWRLGLALILLPQLMLGFRVLRAEWGAA